MWPLGDSLISARYFRLGGHKVGGFVNLESDLAVGAVYGGGLLEAKV